MTGEQRNATCAADVLARLDLLSRNEIAAKYPLAADVWRDAAAEIERLRDLLVRARVKALNDVGLQKRETERLREALRTHGAHAPECVHELVRGQRCVCGLDAALAAAGVSQ